MKKRPIFYILSVFAVFLFISILLQNLFRQDAQGKQFLLGFCPTMEVYAREISGNNSEINIKMFPNSAVVLDHLRSGLIDIGLIGRKAKNNEISSSIREKRLKNGVTLISNISRGIDFNKLSEEIIHTYLDENSARQVLPENTHIIFHNSKEDAFSLSGNYVLLADWEDVPDKYDLLIPFDNDKKVPIFRTPFIYFSDDEIFKKLVF